MQHSLLAIEMLRYALIIILLNSLVSAELFFTSKMIGGNLNITCAGKAITADGIQHPMSMVISRSDDNNYFVASQSMYQSENSFPDSDVTGSFLGNTRVDDPYLSLWWHGFNSSFEGTYLCILYGLGENSTPRSVSQQITITSEDLNPIISTTPKNIIEGLTSSLIVECYSTSLGFENWLAPTQVELYHSYDGHVQLIASAYSSGSDVTVNITAKRWTVEESSTVKDQQLSIAVSYPYPSITESGWYMCDFRAPQNDNVTAIHKVKFANVTSTNFTRNDLHGICTDPPSINDYFLHACNFEHGICGFNLSSTTSDQRWRMMRSLLPGNPLDHTLPDGSGHYLGVDLTSSDGSVTSTMSITLFPPKDRVYCLSLWTFIESGYVRLSRVVSDTQTEFLTAISASKWKQSFVNRISSPSTSLTLIFQSIYAKGYAAIDDIIISDINCL